LTHISSDMNFFNLTDLIPHPSDQSYSVTQYDMSVLK